MTIRDDLRYVFNRPPPPRWPTWKWLVGEVRFVLWLYFAPIRWTYVAVVGISRHAGLKLRSRKG